jgi:hypothetical protein
MAGRMARLTAALVAMPGIIVAVVFGVSGAARLISGRPLIWPPTDVTLSEAVALRDQGEVVRQIMMGSDPNKRYIVRSVFRDDEEVALTPLEAAVITREPYIVDLVVDYGASVNGRNAATLQCLAVGVRQETIRRYLVDLSGEADCEGVELPWRP